LTLAVVSKTSRLEAVGFSRILFAGDRGLRGRCANSTLKLPWKLDTYSSVDQQRR